MSALVLDSDSRWSCFVMCEMAGRRYQVWGYNTEDAKLRAFDYWHDAFRTLYVVKVKWK